MLTKQFCINALRHDRELSATLRAELIRRIEIGDTNAEDLERLSKTHEWFSAILAEEFRRSRRTK